jgi:hypothetical protein
MKLAQHQTMGLWLIVVFVQISGSTIIPTPQKKTQLVRFVVNT